MLGKKRGKEKDKQICLCQTLLQIDINGESRRGTQDHQTSPHPPPVFQRKFNLRFGLLLLTLSYFLFFGHSLESAYRFRKQDPI